MDEDQKPETMEEKANRLAGDVHTIETIGSFLFRIEAEDFEDDFFNTIGNKIACRADLLEEFFVELRDHEMIPKAAAKLLREKAEAFDRLVEAGRVKREEMPGYAEKVREIEAYQRNVDMLNNTIEEQRANLKVAAR
jgi:hypothetical protein